MTDIAKHAILFLGVTGGCALSTLILALQNGYNCIALARTPSKLTRLLKEAGISSSIIDSCLTIQAGDATDVSDLKQALMKASEDRNHLPNIIISGIAGSPKVQFALPPFTIDQPTICEDTADALVTALSQIYTVNPLLQSEKSLLCYVSTGGMYQGEDDIPWILQAMYSYILSIPWRDKKAMEKVFRGEGRDYFKTTIAVKGSNAD